MFILIDVTLHLHKGTFKYWKKIYIFLKVRKWSLLFNTLVTPLTSPHPCAPHCLILIDCNADSLPCVSFSQSLQGQKNGFFYSNMHRKLEMPWTPLKRKRKEYTVFEVAINLRIKLWSEDTYWVVRVTIFHFIDFGERWTYNVRW